ncbi:Gfo/Idh/MocA family protein [Thiomonas sp. FB-6]|uniref:Gfo/Idh/MocA family protein n=1 Tax=Thiomonas sp. FB-6 TaxID=1158291 RepID=UPI00036F8F35|nr:Gfo/Idh/MocA family oxidoreductase [Thiomonas sp. FB-6]
MMERLGRRLRIGVIGGGAGSFIGPVHRIAARLDGKYDLVAAALSSDPRRAAEEGRRLGFAPERVYGSWRELLAREAGREDGIDVVAVMTPNDSHFEICMAALDAGLHILCDKPLSTDVSSARELAARVRTAGAEFCVTYCYSGYPMVRQARDMVRAGELGEIRQVQLQYVQGNLAEPGPSSGWRMQGGRVGGSLVLLDIATHAFHLGAYVTGQDIASLCADVGATRPGGEVDDYVATLMRYANGARGSLWVTNAAAGSEHGLSFRIHGDLGGLEWHQEEPNRLLHRRAGGFDQVLTRRLDPAMSPGALRSTRVALGHPEGYLEAFANLYDEFAEVVAARLKGDRPPAEADLFPGVLDGVKGLLIVEAAARSARSGAWERVEAP